jgi:tetratricopeptide (TPR) repeat protein
MNWIIQKLHEIAQKYFHKCYGLVAATLLLIIIALLIYNLIPDGQFPFSYYIHVIFFIEIILFGLWIFYGYDYPLRRGKKLGFVVAISVEDSSDNKYLKNDFIKPLENKIKELHLPFSALILKNHQAERINDTEAARKILRKTRSQFCIWGSIKKRKNNPEGQKYVFLIRGIVIHKPIREVQQILLKSEFDALLKNKIAFEENLQFEEFEFRSNQVFVALDYITGRAALLSGDFDTAINLHLPLYEAIESGQNYNINKDVIKKLLSIEYDFKASYGLDFNNSVKKSLEFDKNNYGALLKKAIIEFDEGKGSTEEALKIIEIAKEYSNGEYQWLYSKSFLLFWLEDYLNAIKCCDKLKEKSYEGEDVTMKEVIIFNENLLKKFNKPQLYYWLGFVATKNKRDSLADSYFQRFIELADPSMEELTLRARSYLANIKKEIGYN